MEGDHPVLGIVEVRKISIHALRVEGDSRNLRTSQAIFVFLSTPSGWRATRYLLPRVAVECPFLSTPSGWRATRESQQRQNAGFISIHALRVEGDHIFDFEFPIFDISIHALRVEGDQAHSPSPRLQEHFYPRPPGGGRRLCEACHNKMHPISIHALRVEGDPETLKPSSVT